MRVRVNLAELARAKNLVRELAGADQSPVMLQQFNQGLQELTALAQKERFTGKGPFPVPDKKLGVVSGRLRRDLHAEQAEFKDGGITGRIGSIVEYFAAHELGFDGEVSVRAHTRARHTVDRPQQKRRSKTGKEYSVRANKFSRLETSVRAHKMRLKIAKREPLMAALRDHSQRIITEKVRRALASIIDQARKSPA